MSVSRSRPYSRSPSSSSKSHSYSRSSLHHDYSQTAPTSIHPSEPVSERAPNYNERPLFHDYRRPRRAVDHWSPGCNDRENRERQHSALDKAGEPIAIQDSERSEHSALPVTRSNEVSTYNIVTTANDISIASPPSEIETNKVSQKVTDKKLSEHIGANKSSLVIDTGRSPFRKGEQNSLPQSLEEVIRHKLAWERIKYVDSGHNRTVRVGEQDLSIRGRASNTSNMKTSPVTNDIASLATNKTHKLPVNSLSGTVMPYLESNLVTTEISEPHAASTHIADPKLLTTVREAANEKLLTKLQSELRANLLSQMKRF